MRSADRDSQDKNLVGSIDRFAKTSGSRDSADSILTHLYPYRWVFIMSHQSAASRKDYSIYVTEIFCIAKYLYLAHKYI